MKSLIAASVAFLFMLLACGTAAAGGVSPGKPGKITCRSDPSQSYACYLPTKYTSKKKWPILYCFSPDANGMRMVTLCRVACERYGWICVGSNNAKNGPGDVIGAATKAMFDDTHERFSVSPNRCYSTGFSGGSGMAFWMAQKYPKHFAGVIPMAMATSWSENVPQLETHICVFFITGSSDSVAFIRKTADTLKARGNKTEVKTFPGEHELPPPSLVVDAAKWMEDNKPEEPEEGPWEAGMPVAISLKSTLSKRLQAAVSKGAKGDIGGAMKVAEKVLADEKAAKNDLEDAEYVKKRIEKRVKELFDGVEKLFSEKKVFEARELLEKIRKSLSGMEDASKARDRIKELDSDESLKDELKAGGIYAKGLDSESKGKKEKAQKYFRQVMEKYPDTNYARWAKEKAGG